MAKEKPIVAAACLCEKVLEDKDGVLSLIRIVDTFTVGAAPEVFERLNPHLALTLVVILKSKGQVGKHDLTMQLHGPTQSQPPSTVPVEFLVGPLSTVNVRVEIAIGVIKNFGDCRIELSFDGESLTTVPFRVVQGPAPATAGSETNRSEN